MRLSYFLIVIGILASAIALGEYLLVGAIILYFILVASIMT